MLCPLLKGYDFTPGSNLREQETEGGPPRQVPFFVGAWHTVNVSISLNNEDEKEYFWAFWRDKQYKPSNWLWRLALDNARLEECECRFVADSRPKEVERDGKILQLSFQLRIKPIHRDHENDRDIIEAWQNGGPAVIGTIEKVPNEWFPNATGV
ncbi:hypothetical protein ACWL9T_002197 [Acinetobacter baumannii]|uniref:Bacteriophage protein n=3 Tax=Acinetobacter baumannii TaxID=470 RepID=A0AAD2YQL7_ACIBA|nr:hypothetical protein [Acinetobacter baumannii]ETY69587.1 hypothetical protein X964_04015 [Acinetobacter baumannii MDR_MMC4]EGU01857.1 hypothetical protein ABNIH4_09674 [Acinetobacter baumannii ABNIH4]EHU1953803.1 hypothetical protein [Acinetobacter baumannii]EHU3215962.1 hypothetical protein [Acinetobacter baumannii]EHU3218096.1 hypothetical protein [Acinetobacter baumannii]